MNFNEKNEGFKGKKLKYIFFYYYIFLWTIYVAAHIDMYVFIGIYIMKIIRKMKKVHLEIH
jgi:hypothetical protein